MEADMAARYQLISGLLAVVGQPNAQLTASFSRHACTALLSLSMLQVSGSAGEQLQTQLSDACARLLSSVSKLASKGGADQQVIALQLLAACIHTCDLVSLFNSAVGWGTQLTEALRQASVSNNEASDATTAAAQMTEAACRAAAVLFSRLQQHMELPGVRREVTSIAPKLLPQLLAVLQNSHLPNSCQIAGLQLLTAMLRCLPTALRSAASAVEKTLQQIVASTASSASSSTPPALLAAQQQVLAEAAQCIALLPSVPGGAASWSNAARRLLTSIHDVLDYLLMGLEGRPLDAQYRAHLDPAAAGLQQAQAAAPAIGWLSSLPWQQQQQQQGSARRQTLPARMLLGTCISALQLLVAQPFTVPVPVPGYSIAVLASRLLLFDAAAAVAAGAVAGSSTMYQEVLVLQPRLQQAGWQLLQLAIAAAGPQLQLQGVLLRLVRQGLRIIQLSGYAALQQRPVAVRCTVYNTAVDVLQATGLAGARVIAAEALGCAVLELYGHTTVAKPAGGSASSKPGGHRPIKRAKTAGGAAGNDFEQFDPAASAIAAAGDSDTSRLCAAADIQAQAAALQMLQQLLESGRQVLPVEVCAHIDAAVYHLAYTASAAAQRLQQQPPLCSLSSAGQLGCFQVAAYQALQASILVPCSSRPPFLSQALLLFREGRASSDPALAAVCQAAVVQFESLLHPRATAMSSVKQYSGMEAVPVLSKPVMWSAFGVSTQKRDTTAQAEAADAVVLDGFAVAGQLQQQQQQAVQQAGSGATQNGSIVIGYPVATGKQQRQQQAQPQDTLAQPQEKDQTAATAAAAAAVPRSKGCPGTQQSAQPSIKQPQERLQHGNENKDQQKLHQMAVDGGSAAPVVQLQDEVFAAALPLPSTGTVGLVTAEPIKAQPRLQQRAGPRFGQESSDSEGPLPEIDSGSSEERSE